MEFPSDSLQFESQLQSSLVLLGTLVVGIAQAELDEAQIDSGAGSFFGSGHDWLPFYAAAQLTPT
jgi:hypothetical protein